MRPAKCFHALLLIIMVLPTGVAFANSCPAPPSGNLGRGRYQEWCLQTARGKLIDLGGGNMRCDCGSGSSATAYSSTNNPYTPMVEEFLKFWFTFDSNNKASQQRKAAMMRELEAQREQARRNQQQAQAQRLDSILQRLTSGGDMALKGLGGSGGLQLKLGEKRPLGMEVYQHPNDGKKRMGISGLSGIYLDNETPSTTSARLTLKIGDEATRSLQAAPPATSPTPAQAEEPVITEQTEREQAEQAEAKAQVDELARAISQLTPAEQQRLLAAMRGSGDDAPAATPNASPAATNSGLSLKLSGAQAEADVLRAAAADPNASPEELSKQANDQFRNLQGVTAEPVKIESGNAAQPSAKLAVDPAKLQPPPRLNAAGRANTVSPAGPIAVTSPQTRTLIPMVERDYPTVELASQTPGLKGLVGGTTWTYGFQWPQQKCDEQCRVDIGKSLNRQLSLFCSSQSDPGDCLQQGLPFTPQLYDLVVSMGSSHSAIEDLATRVVFDGESFGEFSRQNREIFASLKGHHFDTLDCHSNGAMLCLAALRSRDTTAKEVRLFGPQMNPEAAKRWQEYAKETGTAVKVYINNGDPVPAISWRQPLPQTAAGRATTSVWLANPVVGPAALGEALFFTYLDSKTAVMDYMLRDYGFTVTRTHTSEAGCSGVSVACHSMKLYEKNLAK